MESHEQSLYEQARSGDGRAVDSLIAEYLPRLRAFVRARLQPELRRRESASDVVQSVCRQLVGQREQFHYRGETQFRGWLFTAALNKIREKHRHHHQAKRDVRKESPTADPDDDALWRGYATVHTPSQQAAAREELERLEGAFDELLPEHREVIALARIAGLPHEEVAERMDRSVGAVRQLLGRALLKLSQQLD